MRDKYERGIAGCQYLENILKYCYKNMDEVKIEKYVKEVRFIFE